MLNMGIMVQYLHMYSSLLLRSKLLWVQELLIHLESLSLYSFSLETTSLGDESYVLLVPYRSILLIPILFNNQYGVVVSP